MPRKSSGEVSLRTSSTFSPLAAAASARSALRYILPQAAAGPAGNPWQCNGRPSWPCARTRARAPDPTDRPAPRLHGRLPINQLFRLHLDGKADRREAGALAVAGLEHEQLAVLNRELESCTSLKCDSRVLRTSSNSAKVFGRTVLSLATGSGVRTPATTSSPWALMRKFAVENFLAGGGVAREGDAGAGLVTSVCHRPSPAH